MNKDFVTLGGKTSFFLQEQTSGRTMLKEGQPCAMIIGIEEKGERAERETGQKTMRDRAFNKYC